jgi:hypothetical protein
MGWVWPGISRVGKQDGGVITSRKTNRKEVYEARRARISLNSLKAAIALVSILGALLTSLSAQDLDNPPSNILRQPGWNYGGELSGGSTIVQSAAPRFVTANLSISNVALIVHAGLVLTGEHGSGWIRGTFEWDFSVIPVENFWVLGSHYAGGFEALGPRWNFTNTGRRVVPFVGLSGGMLFSPNNFPPGRTAQFNFTAAVDAGTHLFLRPRHSFDVGVRFQHVSNGYLGRLNPGVPLSLQLTLGYSWY